MCQSYLTKQNKTKQKKLTEQSPFGSNSENDRTSAILSEGMAH